MRLSMCTYTVYIYIYISNITPIRASTLTYLAATGDGRGTVTRHLPIFCQFISEKGMLAQSVIVHRLLFVGEV